MNFCSSTVYILKLDKYIELRCAPIRNKTWPLQFDQFIYSAIRKTEDPIGYDHCDLTNLLAKNITYYRQHKWHQMGYISCRLSEYGHHPLFMSKQINTQQYSLNLHLVLLHIFICKLNISTWINLIKTGQ